MFLLLTVPIQPKTYYEYLVYSNIITNFLANPVTTELVKTLSMDFSKIEKLPYGGHMTRYDIQFLTTVLSKEKVLQSINFGTIKLDYRIFSAIDRQDLKL